MPLTLAINTATSKTEIAIFENGQLFEEISWVSANNEAEKLMPAIKELLGPHDFSEISTVLVVNGPGSFTGLRIGVATANTIANLNNCELHSINTFEYLWLKNPDPQEFTLLVFAGSGAVYVSENPAELGLLTNLPDLKIKSPKVFGDISDKQKEILTVPFIDFHETFGQTIAKLDLSKLQSQKLIQPLYIKDPGITASKKPTF